jgi:hypothetical protein
MPTPIDQRRVIVHAQPIVELGKFKQRSNAIGNVDRQPNQSIQVTRLDESIVRQPIGPPKFLELRGRGRGRLLVVSGIDAHAYWLQKLNARA